MKDRADTFNLTIRALASHVPIDQRLKSILKKLLRHYRFQCVEIREVRGDATVVELSRAQGSDERTAAMQRYLNGAE